MRRVDEGDRNPAQRQRHPAVRNRTHFPRPCASAGFKRKRTSPLMQRHGARLRTGHGWRLSRKVSDRPKRKRARRKRKPVSVQSGKRAPQPK